MKFNNFTKMKVLINLYMISDQPIDISKNSKLPFTIKFQFTISHTCKSKNDRRLAC